MDQEQLALQAVYAANIVVAGVVGSITLFAPRPAVEAVFQHAGPIEVSGRIVGAFWVAVALVSVVGLARPVPMSGLLLVQLLYKGLWLARVAVPAVLAGRWRSLPVGMAVFFVIWVVVLPWAIPWSSWWRG